ncbi:MAG: hypothetical protein IJU68_02570 [Bacteroidales bacterium]|nr:hypothetical protein [Bacteroidales bacterium]
METFKYIGTFALTLSILCSCAQREDYQPIKFLWQEKASVVLSGSNEFWGEADDIVIRNKSGKNEEIIFTTAQDGNNVLLEFVPPVPDVRDLTWETDGDRQKGNGAAVASVRTKTNKFDILFSMNSPVWVGLRLPTLPASWPESRLEENRFMAETEFS